jgi:streptogramin lyase
MHPLLSLTTLLVASLPLVAQESYWIANRTSNDIMQISGWGSVLRRIDMGTGLRSAHVAPDGKVWVVRFIQGTFDIVDPVAGTITPVPSALGSPYDIAFDAQGNAWISGGTGVQKFSSTGAPLQNFPLLQAAPLGITIDGNDNKWIAHRTNPGSVTRIDAAGTVTNHPLPGVLTQPTRLIADYRGLFGQSHIWVVGDGTAQLVELDDQGTLLNVYPLPTTSVGSVTFDRNGDIWVGSFGNGTLLRIDRATGAVLNTYVVGPNINGLSVDSFGRIFATARLSTTVGGPACEVRRINPATGAVEVSTKLLFGSASSVGTQSAVSTQFQYSLVVAPFGDMDGDGDVNVFEILGGTSPTDPTSNGIFRVNTTGTTNLGNTATIDVQTGSLWVLGFAEALLLPGVPVPGLVGILKLDPTSIAGTLSGIGPASISLPIPNDPGLVGYDLVMQGLIFTGTDLEFSNISGVKVW